MENEAFPVYLIRDINLIKPFNIQYLIIRCRTAGINLGIIRGRVSRLQFEKINDLIRADHVIVMKVVREVFLSEFSEYPGRGTGHYFRASFSLIAVSSTGIRNNS